MAAARVLLLSASVGEGHDGPARTLSAALERRGAQTATIDTLAAAGPRAQGLADVGTQYDTRLGNVVFDLAHRAIAEWPPGQQVAGRALAALFGARLLRVVREQRPDVLVATYPGASEVLGRLRARGRLDVPLASAITDLASLRYWAHPGVDEHLVIHDESTAEVRQIAGPRARVTAVHGLVDPAFRAPARPHVARAALGLPVDGRIVVVSGGGWAVGDLSGATDAALASGADVVVVLCGRRADVRSGLQKHFAAVPAVRMWGFTERMAALLAAADVLVHSTAGLTVLEAMMCGCRVISFGWGRGHIRANNRAYRQHGLAAVVDTPPELATHLTRALAAPRAEPFQPSLPEAADRVLALGPLR
jgi:processive 1,2-diacylglycerol beta-glucosyltransferase